VPWIISAPQGKAIDEVAGDAVVDAMDEPATSDVGGAMALPLECSPAFGVAFGLEF
jgi:hypothetical protein